jgi:hypothetical protein
MLIVDGSEFKFPGEAQQNNLPPKCGQLIDGGDADPVILTFLEKLFLEKGSPQPVTHYTSFACPGIHTQGVGFMSHSKDEAIEVTYPRSQASWSMTGIKPTMFGS